MQVSSYPDRDVSPEPVRFSEGEAEKQEIIGMYKRGTWMGLAAAAMLAAPVTSLAYDPPPSTFFPVGVFLQPTSTFDTWKARGINTVVDYWGDQTALEQWNAAAVAHGFYMIRGPRTDLSKDVNEKYLLAWSHHDEPDYNNISPTQIAAETALMKAADPKRPVFTNFAGGYVVNPYFQQKIDYKAYINATDIVANDIYPITAWNHPEWIDFSKPLNPKDIYNPTPTIRLNPGTTVDLLRNMSGGKTQYAYIETSWQDNTSPTAGSRGVTPAEFRGEVWDAIIHGAKGIIYFPQRVGATVFMNDNTPADVAAEMTKQDALIASLGGVISSSSDKTDNRVAFNNGDLEGTWRTYQGKTYLFVLNMSSQTLTNLSFTTTGLDKMQMLQVYSELRSENVVNGNIVDTFAPYQLHVYTTDGAVSGSLVVGAPVPEPTGGAMILAAGAYGLLRRRRKAG
jgi:hypothetical protein